MATPTAAPGLCSLRPCKLSRTSAGRPTTARVPVVTRCQASSNQEHPLGVTRRSAVLAAAILLGSSSVAEAASAAATQKCTDFVTAPNGIKFCEIQEGTGPSPQKGAMIRCHYMGRLASNGAVFDSSYERRRPLSFKIGVGQVIAGWDQGILGADGIPPMKEGGKRQLIIPSELAYGERGAGGVIPPKATLIFDVELLGKR
ncbi:hypothetical protein WJX72_003523 [[Myrmecia] bisecta]|uniref:peptidylprolyl isomerase n=1 Tax=[Myrmecia] bisecta TaxID=41462 RepID=A0AAW1PZV2_9CHLO